MANKRLRPIQRLLRSASGPELTWEAARSLLLRAHPSLNKVLKRHADGKPLEQYDMRVLSMIAHFTNDHDLYEAIIARFDENLAAAAFHSPVERSAQQFIGSGLGTGSLNAYRRTIAFGGAAFEKIYFTEADSCANMLYVHEALADILEGVGVPVPRLLGTVRGPKLTAAYFDLQTVTRIGPEDYEGLFALVPRIMAVECPETPAPPFFFFEVAKRPRVRKGYGRLAEDLRRADRRQADRIVRNLGTWMVWLADQRRVLAHGDLNLGNISGNGMILDWDSCGLLPFGYDLACLACSAKYLQHPDRFDEVTQRFVAPLMQDESDRIAYLFLSAIMLAGNSAIRSDPAYPALLLRLCTEVNDALCPG